MRCIANTDEIAHFFFFGGGGREGGVCLNTRFLLILLVCLEGPAGPDLLALQSCHYTMPSTDRSKSTLGVARASPSQLILKGCIRIPLLFSFLTQMYSQAFYIHFLLCQNCLCLSSSFPFPAFPPPSFTSKSQTHPAIIYKLHKASSCKAACLYQAVKCKANCLKCLEEILTQVPEGMQILLRQSPGSEVILLLVSEPAQLTLTLGDLCKKDDCDRH